MSECGAYQVTTIDHDHPDPRYRTRSGVSVHLQMDYGEVVAGAHIDTGRSRDTDTDHSEGD